MEQLLALAYTDTFLDTVLSPAAPAVNRNWKSVATLNTAAPVDGYVDWLEEDGDLLGEASRAIDVVLRACLANHQPLKAASSKYRGHHDSFTRSAAR